MTKNLDNEGLRAIAENYDLFYIDLWGVVHNGIKLHEKAIFVLKELSKLNKNTLFWKLHQREVQVFVFPTRRFNWHSSDGIVEII